MGFFWGRWTMPANNAVAGPRHRCLRLKALPPQGQANLGVGAFAGLALYAEAAAVLFDDGLGEDEARAGPTAVVVGARIEGAVYEGLLRAGAAVRDFYEELRTVFEEAGAEPEVAAALGQRVERIAQQLGYGLPELELVHDGVADLWGYLQVQADGPLGELVPRDPPVYAR